MSDSLLLAQPPYPWLNRHWKIFSDGAINSKLQHAILIHGQEGLGCSELALAMSQYLLCVASQGPISCGNCRSCQLLKAQSHPDFFMLQPEEKSSVIKIGQIRELTEFVANTAQQGGRKVVVIEPADAMNVAAANALLKSLEEPTSDTFFILVSTQAARLLATIRSRCAQMQVSPPSEIEGIAWLERNQVQNAESLLRDARGAPLSVLAWIDEDIVEKRLSLAEDFDRLMLGQVTVVDCAKKIVGLGCQWVVEQLLRWVEDAIRLSSQQADVSSGEGLVSRLAKKDLTGLFRLRDSLMVRKGQLLSGANPNEALLVEEVLIALTMIAESR